MVFIATRVVAFTKANIAVATIFLPLIAKRHAGPLQPNKTTSVPDGRTIHNVNRTYF